MSQVQPLISVLMPVYNVEGNPRQREYLITALQSVLAQDYPNWELVAVNDGSMDGTGQLLDAWSAVDSRIRVLHLAENGGISAALNQAAATANGLLFARMDADDISVPYRLSVQVDFLNRHKTVDIVGGPMLVINEDAFVVAEARRPQTHEEVVRFAAEVGCPFVHGSVVMRRSIFEQVGGYSTAHEWDYCEDYEMWFRVLRAGRGHNLAEFLYLYRQHSQSVGKLRQAQQAVGTAKIQKMFQAHFGYAPLSDAA